MTETSKPDSVTGSGASTLSVKDHPDNNTTSGSKYDNMSLTIQIVAHQVILVVQK